MMKKNDVLFTFDLIPKSSALQELKDIAEGGTTDTIADVGMVVPYKSFGVREYTKAVTSAISTLQRSTRGPRLEMFQRYDIHVLITMKELTPSPTGEY
ncbi:hypothetical protein KQX54_011769 [Cotesia glomerata]|uniref:Uncharacterized protein n=1 Tax=Cotesia glomerata TaxID=32391 RepID=A0AAV7IWJ3_COTGL|nr:hypothetical protein KQX54_011769 [Cotesia glomerata]